MQLNSCNCSPTYLVTAVNESGGTAYTLTFRTTPTLLNKSVIKFRVTDGLSTVATSGLPILANVNFNGALVSVPLLDSIGNNVRTGEGLKTRTTYTAVFGSDPNHLQIIKVKGRSCLGV